ncbi:hypothetical protein [Dyadobacter bucti]|uniref:hypothetical protein n=1 Tax=Dyadobacter bucti TaxID=2572203 RepID=UPI003F7020AB
MTNEEADKLIEQATPFIGRRKILSYPHPQTKEQIVESNSQFVRIDKHEVEGDYNPLAVYQEEGDLDDEWTEDLQKTIDFFNNLPEKERP